MVIFRERTQEKEPIKGKLVNTRDKDSLVGEHMELETGVQSRTRAWRREHRIGRALATAQLRPSAPSNSSLSAQNHKGRCS